MTWSAAHYPIGVGFSARFECTSGAVVQQRTRQALRTLHEQSSTPDTRKGRPA